MRRLVVAAVAVPAASIAVLAVEVGLAGRGDNLPERDPYQLDATAGPGPGPVLRMVWLGDSTAAGVGSSSPATTLPRLVAAQVSTVADRPVVLTGLAVSGARIVDVLQDQVALVPADSDIVLMSIGSNDVTHLTSSSTFRSTYVDVLERLPAGVDVVLLGVPDFGAPPRLAQPLRAVTAIRGRTIDGVVAAIARERDVGYVDIAGRTGPTFRREPDRMFADDGYHPSDAGYRLWADAVAPVVEDVLARR